MHDQLRTQIDDRLGVWLLSTGLPSLSVQSVFELRTLANALTLPWLGEERRLDMLECALQLIHAGDPGGSGSAISQSPRTIADVGTQHADHLIDFRRRLADAMLARDRSGAELSLLAMAPPANPVEDGRRIGRQLQSRVEEIKALIGGPNSPQGPDWPKQLARIDRLVRMLDGVSNEQVDPNAGLADALNSLRLEDYLVNQARRTWEDFWHDESFQTVPYNRRVARAYLDNAREIDQLLHDVRRKTIDSMALGPRSCRRDPH